MPLFSHYMLRFEAFSLKPRIPILLLTCLFLVAPLPGGATENTQVLRLSLPQAVTLALDENPDISLSRHRIESAVIGVEAARGQFLPALQASASGSENLVHRAAPGAEDEYQNADVQISAGLNLFNGFADSAGLETSHLQLQAADFELRRQRQNIAYSVASRFIAVLIDHELIQVAS